MGRKTISISASAFRAPLSEKQPLAHFGATPAPFSQGRSSSQIIADKENIPHRANVNTATTTLQETKPSKEGQDAPCGVPLGREELRKRVEAVVALHLAKRKEEVSQVATTEAESYIDERKVVSLQRETVRRDDRWRSALSLLLVFLVLGWSAARVVLQQQKVQRSQTQWPVEKLDVVPVTDMLLPGPSVDPGVLPSEPYSWDDSFGVTASMDVPFVEAAEDCSLETPSYDAKVPSTSAPETALTDSVEPEVLAGEQQDMAEAGAIAVHHPPAMRSAVGQQLQISLRNLRALLVNTIQVAVQRARAVALRWWERARGLLRRKI